jgi:protein-S-isoprenylcysteine O-methyltransferase Ste14
MDIFPAVYFLAIIIQIFIRAPFDRTRRREKVSESRFTGQEKAILVLLLIGGLIVPIIYAATNWLDFANYNLPTWAGWLGIVLTAFSLFVFWRAHLDLGANWSPTLEIHEKHELITHGIYRFIRHPMYASQWILALAQPLLLQNWIAGFINLLAFLPFYLLRVREEEKLMLEQFGEQYRSYMRTVGSVFPKF